MGWELPSGAFRRDPSVNPLDGGLANASPVKSRVVYCSNTEVLGFTGAFRRDSSVNLLDGGLANASPIVCWVT